MKQFRIVLPPKELTALRGLVHVRDGWKCRHCGYRNSLNAHHIIFRSQGGDDTGSNLVSLCQRLPSGGCHEAVHRGDLVLVNPEDPSQPVNANKKIRFIRRNGWSP